MNFIQQHPLTGILIGIALLLMIGRRRFYRRTWGGLQAFRNYRSALFVPVIESIIKWAAILLILYCLLHTGCFQKHQKSTHIKFKTTNKAQDHGND